MSVERNALFTFRPHHPPPRCVPERGRGSTRVAAWGNGEGGAVRAGRSAGHLCGASAAHPLSHTPSLAPAAGQQYWREGGREGGRDNWGVFVLHCRRLVYL